MSAVLFKYHAAQHALFHSRGRSPFLGGRQDVNPRVETLAGGSHLFVAAGASFVGRLTQSRAQAVAGGASAASAADLDERQVKTCLECQHSKLVVDFEKTVSSMDGRTDVCRACLAVSWAKSTQRELHHLGMSVTEAWERAKACRRCGLTKELRDFARDSSRKDQMQARCRACSSAFNRGLRQYPPTDQPLQCIRCGEVRAATQFPVNLRMSIGRSRTCKSCIYERTKHMQQTRRSTQVYIPRETKRCSACGKEKLVCEFYLDSKEVDGLRNVCRSCTRVAVKKRYGLRKQASEQ